MKNKRNIIRAAIFVFTAIFVVSVCGISAAAYTQEDEEFYFNHDYGSSDKRVYDYDDLLTDDEEADIEAAIDEVTAKTELDLVIVTSDGSYGTDYVAFADDFYDYNGFGIGENSSGLLLLLDMGNRMIYISTTGDGITEFTNSYCTSMTDSYISSMQSGNYRTVCMNFVKDVKHHVIKSITLVEAAVALVITAIVFALMYFFILKSYKTNGQEFSYDTAANTTLDLVDSHDDLIDVRHTTVKINRDSGGGSGGGSHTSSSGRSHGGGGSKF